MELIAQMFVTLDGVAQGPGGGDEDRRGGFEQGGWQVPFGDEDTGRLITRWFEQADAFLLGRTTYDIFSTHWPKVTDPDDPVATRLNRLPKYVVSTTLEAAEWEPTTILRDLDAVAEVKQQPGRELQVHGSPRLVRALIGRGLLDELRLWTYPVVLGDGTRLFEPGTTPSALELVDTTITSTGCIVAVYRPAGPPQFGSYLLDDYDEEKRRLWPQ